ncbi:hypothetical protein TRKP33_p0311 (plasmid) [Klebsiella pneumoniae]|nr:hypothetical protein TRKP33_p0311 [Klebsiella pneumoniae]
MPGANFIRIKNNTERTYLVNKHPMFECGYPPGKPFFFDCNIIVPD